MKWLRLLAYVAFNVNLGLFFYGIASGKPFNIVVSAIGVAITGWHFMQLVIRDREELWLPSYDFLTSSDGEKSIKVRVTNDVMEYATIIRIDTAAYGGPSYTTLLAQANFGVLSQQAAAALSALNTAVTTGSPLTRAP